jgi:hypothetical protein
MYLFGAALLVAALSAPSLAQSYGANYRNPNSPSSGNSIYNHPPRPEGIYRVAPKQTDTRYNGLNNDGNGGNFRPGDGYY